MSLSALFLPLEVGLSTYRPTSPNVATELWAVISYWLFPLRGLAVANEYNLAFVFLKLVFQHSDIFGTSSFLISHDEIITNITSKGIRTA